MRTRDDFAGLAGAPAQLPTFSQHRYDQSCCFLNGSIIAGIESDEQFSAVLIKPRKGITVHPYLLYMLYVMSKFHSDLRA